MFLFFAFGIAWATAAWIWSRGGLFEGPVLMPSIGLTEAVVLMATVYMWAPALAHLLTRWLTDEGWSGTLLRPNFASGLYYYAAAWLGTPALVLAGAALFFLVLPQHFDSDLVGVADLLERVEARTGQAVPVSPRGFLWIQLAQAVAIGPIVNLLAVFGEEFGWRAYLQPKLLALGTRKALVVTGLIWAVWHWPLIAMGHNYGQSPPGAPLAPLLVFTVFIVPTAVFIGWVSLRARSVWPAVVAHGSLNGIAAAGLLVAHGDPNPLLGPTPAGLIGAVPFIAVGVWLLTGRILRAEERSGRA